MKALLIVISVFLLVLAAAYSFVQGHAGSGEQSPAASAGHIYASWDTMEFDKCVAAWLIARFLDRNAEFVLHPQGTQIDKGVVFDVPGVAWSRKHRKCTSDCILESREIDDPVVKEIVAMAHVTELNHWRLDEFPQVQKYASEVQVIFDSTPDRNECLEKAIAYFDNLYDELRKGQPAF